VTNKTQFFVLPYIFLFLFVIRSYSDERLVNWQEEDISFKVKGFALHGVLIKPLGQDVFPAVIFVHGDGPIDRTMLGYYAPIWERFIEAGYACMSWDKPGVGKSTGSFGDGNLFHDRAKIAAAAVTCLKARKDIDGDFIGFWGISQAGYIMPMALTMTDDIAFMIAISCPGVNSIEQGAYFIKRQLISEGSAKQEAQQYADYYLKSRYAKSYEEYSVYAELLGRQPYLENNGWAEIKSKDRYVPHQPDSESSFNPISILEEASLPVLAIFGGKDTQIPAKASSEAYRKALQKAGNEHVKVIVFPGADHVIFNSLTGSLKEWEDKFRNKQMDYASMYLDTMAEWLNRIKSAR